MDLELSQLLRQKLAAIARDEDARLVPSIKCDWGMVNQADDCIWVGDLMHSMNVACCRAVIARGTRLIEVLAETLNNLKPPYEESLAEELKAVVDSLFPEDLYLAQMVNCRGLYERRGNSTKFDERTYEHQFTLAKVGIANNSRRAKLKAHLVIDEYTLLAKNDHHATPSIRMRLWESINMKPAVFGIGIDLKKLFSRKKGSARNE